MLRDETKNYISIQKWVQKQKIAVKRIRTKSKKIRMTPFIFGRTAWISRKWEREKGGEEKKKSGCHALQNSMCVASLGSSHRGESNAMMEGHVWPLQSTLCVVCLWWIAPTHWLMQCTHQLPHDTMRLPYACIKTNHHNQS